jgi:TatD DNase family protein
VCLQRARTAGVSGILVPGVHPAQWGPLRTFAQANGLLFGVGTHPQCLVDTTAVPVDLDGAVAIGECGLDGPTPVVMETQEAVLEGHLALARDSGLPLILHCFRAHHRLLPLLRRWAPVRGVLHSYSGGPELVRDYVAVGLHLSFAGPVTFENARKPVASLLQVPRDRLLAETDAPDQCPRPHRGRSEPAFVVDVIRAMERLRGEDLAAALDANAASLGWGPS